MAARNAAAPAKRPAQRAQARPAPQPAALQVSLQGSLQLSLQFADPRHRSELPRHRVRRWLLAALQGPAQLTVRVVDEAEGLSLNRDFREQDHATNVLTFNYERAPVVVADLVLCAPVVAREAQALGLGLQAHYAHLLVHGALHAQGMDHIVEAEAQAMERRETEILARLGIADPYGS